jgi:hypothetical protein
MRKKVLIKCKLSHKMIKVDLKREIIPERVERKEETGVYE